MLTRKKLWQKEIVEIPKTHRKRWYENNKELIVRSQSAYVHAKEKKKEQMINYERQYSKNNMDRLNGYCRGFYSKSKEQIRQRLREQRQRKIGRPSYTPILRLPIRYTLQLPVSFKSCSYRCEKISQTYTKI